ncbi:Arc family DNA-binding protein [Variovorax sp. S2]|uniref:Arc family DNA-binding protein n=1 Tax=Variovorax sp. S12S4 TaxID=3029170 RepID=UPI00215B8C45|nr:Arc family DNA-binding protein [Variovorax sp. S12S4]MCR8961182.1 Arc family DNA-binding protein [Variovorax sp. S12S4]
MSSQKDFVKTALRLPPDLHASLHGSAKESERTFNAEILHRLRSSFKARRVPHPVTSKGTL